MENDWKIHRNIDIVFCIDGTGSMLLCIENVKRNVQKICKDFLAQASEVLSSVIDGFHVKLITFRDYRDDEYPMVESEWFDVKGDGLAGFEACVKGIEADGGGDMPENGLEALYFAMTTDWHAIDSKDRQIIVLFSDADAVDLLDEDRKRRPNYPSEMVDFDGLVALWAGELPPYMAKEDYKLGQRTKRMVLFARAGTKYEELARHCSNTFFIPVPFDGGLMDLEIDDIVREMSASCAG